MWVLRKPSEITQVTCINLLEPFTIGRIECSFNITDDKSVSRRHASITFPPSLTHPLLTDCGSKFGTFLNGDKVTAPQQLKHGDTIKFGGATSEFVLESKDFSVFVKSIKLREMFKELETKFGISVLDNLNNANYLVIDDKESIEEVDSDLISAFLSSKFIVSPTYFSQLNQSNTFSLGLIQPALNSKLFPMDSWLPRKERVNVLRNAFEGIKRFISFEGDEYERILKIIGSALSIETKILNYREIKDIKFNDLLVTSVHYDPKDLIDPIRTVNYKSIIDALIRCDCKLIDINTVYPEKPKERTPVVFAGFEPTAIVTTVVEKRPTTAIDVEPKPIVKEESTEYQDLNYKGPSLTALLPMPATFLRPTLSQPSSDSAESTGKPPKFVKCHPNHRLPGTIPALFGPDQLQPCRPVATNSNNATVQGTKRRVLVRDAWLAEDEVVEDDDDLGANVKENKRQRSTQIETNIQMNKPAASASSSTTAVAPSSTSPPPSIVPSTTSTVKNSPPSVTTTTTGSTSKFQSSFFKNLSKPK